MKFSYDTKRVCTKTIEFDMDENFVVTNVNFYKGCPGNTVGVAKLSSGRNALELVGLLEGTTCEKNKTSCPDQFAAALKDAMVKIKGGNADKVNSV